MTINARYKELYRKAAEFHKELIGELNALFQENLKTEALEDLADICFVTWHLERLGVDIKKKLNSLDEIAIKALCIRWINSTINGEPVRTDYATFSPSVTEVPRLPSQKEEPEKYAACLKALGIPDAAIETGTVRIHWPALQEYKERLDMEGLPLPPEFNGEQFATYQVRVSHKRKEVLE